MGFWLVQLSAIAAITGMELYALNRGLDSLVLTLSIGSVAGIGGYAIKSYLVKKSERNDRNGEK